MKWNLVIYKLPKGTTIEDEIKKAKEECSNHPSKGIMFYQIYINKSIYIYLLALVILLTQQI